MCIINESQSIIITFYQHYWNQFQKCFSTVYDTPMFPKMSIIRPFWAILALIMHNLCNKSLIMHPPYTKLVSCLSLTIWKTHSKFSVQKFCSFREKVEQTDRRWVLLYRRCWNCTSLYCSLFNFRSFGQAVFCVILWPKDHILMVDWLFSQKVLNACIFLSSNIVIFCVVASLFEP